eukprot:jgi/Chlat1/3576/Chrsp234S03566
MMLLFTGRWTGGRCNQMHLLNCKVCGLPQASNQHPAAERANEFLMHGSAYTTYTTSPQLLGSTIFKLASRCAECLCSRMSVRTCVCEGVHACVALHTCEYKHL